jgi:hypothetical protein
MVEFYITRDATKMMAFIVDCHPSAAQIHEINDTAYDVPDKGRSDHYRLEMPASPQFERPGALGSTDDGEPKHISPPRVKRYSSEEVRRRARENWLQNYYGREESDGRPASNRRHDLEEKQEDTLSGPAGRNAELGDEPEG